MQRLPVLARIHDSMVVADKYEVLGPFDPRCDWIQLAVREKSIAIGPEHPRVTLVQHLQSEDHFVPTNIARFKLGDRRRQIPILIAVCGGVALVIGARLVDELLVVKPEERAHAYNKLDCPGIEKQLSHHTLHQRHQHKLPGKKRTKS